MRAGDIGIGTWGRFAHHAWKTTLVMGLLLSTVPVFGATDVAIVAMIEGQVVSRVQGSDKVTLELFDRLGEGAVADTADNGKLTLILFGGQRFEVQPNSTVIVRFEGVKALRGQVVALESVPVMVELAGLPAAGEMAGPPLATRIRHASAVVPAPAAIEPRDGAAIRADDSRLSFTSVEGAERYLVTVEERGGEVFRVETESSEVRLPPGTLRRGTTYAWAVSAVVDGQMGSKATAIIWVLDDDEEELRNAVAEQAGSGADPSLNLLLVDLDVSLGLYREACDGLTSVAATVSDGEAVRAVMDKIGCGL